MKTIPTNLVWGTVLVVDLAVQPELRVDTKLRTGQWCPELSIARYG
jgi:hypothetical protein